MNVGIIGSGVVGHATGVGLSKLGHAVTFNDIDINKLDILASEGYRITKNNDELLNDNSIILVCVPTPNRDGQQDLSIIYNVLSSLGESLAKTSEYKVIVIRSTILPTYTRTNLLPRLQEVSDMTPGSDFGLCVNPEFLRQVSALDDFLNPWRIVIGEYDERSGSTLEEMYKPLRTKIVRTTLETAELIKYVSNAFLTTKISFFNEMYLIARKLKIDPNFISTVVALDPRIGTYGTIGGRPFEGSCLPKDTKALKEFCVSLGLNPLLLTSTLDVNKKIRKC